LTPATIHIQYSYFYYNPRQKYLYLSLRNGLEIAKNKMLQNIVDYLFGT